MSGTGRYVLVLSIMLLTVATFALPGCSKGPRAEPADGPVTARAAQREGDAARPATAQESSKRYFQRMLIEYGDDLRSEFGGDLSSLGFHGRDLQALPIDQAYSRVHATAMRVGDSRLRRKILLHLFNEVEG